MSHHTLVLILVLSLASGLAVAAPPENVVPDDKHAAVPMQYAYVSDGAGFLMAVPQVDAEALTDGIKSSRNVLRERREQLSQHAKDTEINFIDVLITVAAPGGLLYAGYRLHAQTMAKSALESVDNDLEQLDTDLLAFQGIAGTQFLAMGPF